MICYDPPYMPEYEWDNVIEYDHRAAAYRCGYCEFLEDECICYCNICEDGYLIYECDCCQHCDNLEDACVCLDYKKVK
jgi:hypothetical protein